MFSALRRQLSYSNVAATMALVFALTGGAFAATSHSGGGSPARATASASHATVAKKKSKAPARGPAGPKGATGAAGPQGATGPAGPTGPAGAAGAKGENGSPGAQGPEGKEGKAGTNGTNGTNGKNGSPWTAGGTLPPGSTETGAWNIIPGSVPGVVSSLTSLTTISFPIPLAAPLGRAETAAVTVEEQEGKKTPPAGCTGTVETPTAEAGHLCVYQSAEIPPGPPITSWKLGLSSEGFFHQGASTAGAVLGTIENVQDEGTWAVTGAVPAEP
jgi:hypothetical protein